MLARELQARAADPGLVVHVKGTVARTVGVDRTEWETLARNGDSLLLRLGVLREVGPSRFLYDAERAASHLVMLYDALEEASAPDGDYNMHVLLWMPKTDRVVEREPGPWSVLAPEILWSATEGQHLSRRELRELDELDELMRGPTATRCRDVREWLSGFVRARGLLLQLEEDAPVWEY